MPTDLKTQFALKKPCSECPFSYSEAGTHLRESLNKGRLEGIVEDLLNDRKGNFTCHVVNLKNAELNYDNDGVYKPQKVTVCAGAIGFAHKKGIVPTIERMGIMFNLIEPNHYEAAESLAIDPKELDNL